MNGQENDVPMVPKYWAENLAMHLGRANLRMLLALIAVCLTSIIIIIVFVRGYTEREKNWLDAMTAMKTAPVTEVDRNGGVYQQQDAGADP